MRALVLIGVFAALAVAGGSSAQGNPLLLGTVGPGFSIRLTDTTGARATNIPPGTYTIRVTDLSPEHNFHLTGPGVDMTTQVDATGTAVWTVTFQVGTYHYECDAHPLTMKSDVTVSTGAPPVSTNPPSPPTTSPGPIPPPPVKRPVLLRATVGPGARITLTKAGVRVRALTAGPAVITVNDLSTKDNFHLIGPGVNRLTSKAAKVKVTWRATLRPGIYRYRSDASIALKGLFAVRR
jgi:hypothetical protein